MKHEQTLNLQIIEMPDIQFKINSIEILLSSNQLRVLEQILAGSTNKEIANQINLSEQGVKYHVTILFKMFCVENRSELRSKIIHLKHTGTC